MGIEDNQISMVTKIKFLEDLIQDYERVNSFEVVQFKD